MYLFQFDLYKATTVVMPCSDFVISETVIDLFYFTYHCQVTEVQKNANMTRLVMFYDRIRSYAPYVQITLVAKNSNKNK